LTIFELKSKTAITSQRSEKLGVSGIRAIFEKAQTIPDVIRLEFGEPDFDTPKNIKDAAIRAISRGETKYTSGAGIPELRKAVSKKLERENGIFYEPLREVVVSAGATSGIYFSLLATLDAGDEILIPNPGWATYAFSVNLAGAVPIQYNLESSTGYSFRTRTVEPLVTQRTKAILINTPSNPMGSVLSRNNVEEVANFAKRYNLTVISDEVYEKFLYPDTIAPKLEYVSIGSLPEMKDRTVTVNSFSKTYAMTGWRIGYVAASEKIAQAIVKINTASSSCISSVSQFAALEALEGPQDSVKQMIATYQKRRDEIVKRLNQIHGFECPVPSGAFYAFPDISASGLSSFDLSMKILEKAHVATVPGSAFGSKGEGHLRLAYANSLENIQAALDRISRIVN
jgi:aminotransferase